jgi:hypothetical protein
MPREVTLGFLIQQKGSHRAPLSRGLATSFSYSHSKQAFESLFIRALLQRVKAIHRAFFMLSFRNLKVIVAGVIP